MSFKDMIKTSVLNNLASDITFKRIVIVLIVSMILGMYVFLIYRIAVNNEFYSKDFNRTLVLMSVTTAAIVLALQSNLVISLGMVGALSIVRYRTAIKSPIDLFFMFWSISIGIICGAGLYILAAALCVVLTAGFFLTERMASPKSPGLLVINCDSLDAAEHVTQLVTSRTKLIRVKNKMVYKDNVELILEYKTDDEKALEAALSADDAVKNYSMMCYDSTTRT